MLELHTVLEQSREADAGLGTLQQDLVTARPVGVGSRAEGWLRSI